MLTERHRGQLERKMLVTLTAGLIVVATAPFTRAVAAHPNVLVVIFDDLRPAVTGFSNPGTQSIVTPSLNRLLADPGTTVMDRTFVQQAVCGPSRVSFLTGRRPDSTKLYDFGSYWRDAAGNWSTWPQLLRQAGYATHSIGKVFHPLASMKKGGHVDDFPYSWTEPGWHPPTQAYKGAAVCDPVAGVQPPRSVLNKSYTNILCPVIPTAMPGGSLPDLQSADYAVELLGNLSRQAATPWLVAVGFHKPHIPFKFPAEYLKAHPIDSIETPPDSALPDLLPHVAYDPWTDVQSRDDVSAVIAANNISFPFGPLPMSFAKQLRQHYYASVTYVDAQLGRVLDALQTSGAADNTIVALWGDHGWQLGERDEWAKYSTCDTATRIPLVLRMPPSLRGRSSVSAAAPITSSALIEIVDIGPTLLDLCGVPVPAVCPPTTGNTTAGQPDTCFEGTSFADVLRRGDDDGGWTKNVAWSQYPRPSNEPEQDSDLPSCINITVMGYSMRRSDLRFTEWVGFRCRVTPSGLIQSQADWSDVHATELYLHNHSSAATDDVYESSNVADEPENAALVAQLRLQLRAGWRSDLPPHRSH